MAWTTRHCRAFHRSLSTNARVYTEMVSSDALLHGPRERLLAYNECEHPIALQLGGSDPTHLAQCARYAEARGFDEVNLNVGCPSDRVQRGRFGACLMLDRERIGQCIAAMRDVITIPVTIKCRLGLDGHDNFTFLRDFVGTCAESGTNIFIIHARIAILQGLSPAQNRDVPPLEYDKVQRLKKEFPDLSIILNGGIRTTDQVVSALAWADGIMLGRGAYQNPYWLTEVEHLLFGTPLPSGPKSILTQHFKYIESELRSGVRLQDMTRHMLCLFNGLPGARAYRRHLSEHARAVGAGIEVIEKAASLVTHKAA